MKQRGGIIIGEGTYGCVLKPSVRCRSRDGRELGNQPDDVAKVMYETDAIEEIREINKIKRFDERNIFTLPMAEYCDISYGEQPEGIRRDIDNCVAVEDGERIGREHGNPMSALIMKDGGVPFEDYIQETYESGNPNINKILSGLWRVFYGLKVINDNKYIHNDIKSDNIVVKNKDGELRFNIIDFGLMTQKNIVRYIGDYFIYPISNYFILIGKEYYRILYGREYFNPYRHTDELYNEIRKYDENRKGLFRRRVMPESLKTKINELVERKKNINRRNIEYNPHYIIGNFYNEYTED
jgi:serine/threonine protein kinase